MCSSRQCSRWPPLWLPFYKREKRLIAWLEIMELEAQWPLLSVKCKLRARCCVAPFMYFVLSYFYNSGLGVVILTLQMKKISSEKWSSWHTCFLTGEWRSQDLDPNSQCSPLDPPVLTRVAPPSHPAAQSKNPGTKLETSVTSHIVSVTNSCPFHILNILWIYPYSSSTHGHHSSPNHHNLLFGLLQLLPNWAPCCHYLFHPDHFLYIDQLEV